MTKVSGFTHGEASLLLALSRRIPTVSGGVVRRDAVVGSLCKKLGASGRKTLASQLTTDNRRHRPERQTGSCPVPWTDVLRL
jgi:hypothetical protein